MYNVIKIVITSKRYELKDILTKIDTLWVQGSLTDEQRLELIDLARNNAMISNSIDMLAKLDNLDKRVKTLEEALAALDKESADEESSESGDIEIETPEDEESQPDDTDGEGTEGDNTEVIKPTYPEYEAGVWYRNGDIVSFEGENYKCIVPDDQVCVWSPKDYPVYWSKI